MNAERQIRIINENIRKIREKYPDVYTVIHDEFKPRVFGIIGVQYEQRFFLIELPEHPKVRSHAGRNEIRKICQNIAFAYERLKGNNVKTLAVLVELAGLGLLLTPGSSSLGKTAKLSGVDSKAAWVGATIIQFKLKE